MAFSPDGQTLAVVTGYSADVELRDVETGALGDVLEGHASVARAVAYTPDGSKIVTGGADGTVRLWTRSPLGSAGPGPFQAPKSDRP